MNKFEHAGCTVKIEVDEDPQNPRKEYDNLGTFAFFHKRYDLGDDLEKKLRTSYLKSGNFNGWEAMQAYIEKEFQPVYITPVFMYDHSGLTISTTPFHCPWDSGRIGFAFITREQDKRERRTKRAGKGEYDAEKFAHQRLNKWREATGKQPVPPRKQDNPFGGDQCGMNSTTVPVDTSVPSTP